MPDQHRIETRQMNLYDANTVSNCFSLIDPDVAISTIGILQQLRQTGDIFRDVNVLFLDRKSLMVAYAYIAERFLFLHIISAFRFLTSIKLLN